MDESEEKESCKTRRRRLMFVVCVPLRFITRFGECVVSCTHDVSSVVVRSKMKMLKGDSGETPSFLFSST
jgi:hypothetical protein